MVNKHPDKFTYWKSEGVDHMGQPNFDGPYVEDCRWEDEQRLFITDTGKEERGRSTIYTKNQYVDIGDYVVEGVSTDTTPPPRAFEVKNPRKIKNIRGTRVEYRFIV